MSATYDEPVIPGLRAITDSMADWIMNHRPFPNETYPEYYKRYLLDRMPIIPFDFFVELVEGAINIMKQHAQASDQLDRRSHSDSLSNADV